MSILLSKNKADRVRYLNQCYPNMSSEGSTFTNANFYMIVLAAQSNRLNVKKYFYYILVKLHSNKDVEFATEQRSAK